MFNIPYILPELFFLTAKSKHKGWKSSDSNRKWSILSWKRKVHSIQVSLKKEYNKYCVNISNQPKRISHIPKCPLKERKVYQPVETIFDLLSTCHLFQPPVILLSLSLKRTSLGIYTGQFFILCDCSLHIWHLWFPRDLKVSSSHWLIKKHTQTFPSVPHKESA